LAVLGKGEKNSVKGSRFGESSDEVFLVTSGTNVPPNRSRCTNTNLSVTIITVGFQTCRKVVVLIHLSRNGAHPRGVYH